MGKRNIKTSDKIKRINDPKKIVNIFNDHFSTIGEKVQQKIPTVNSGSYRDYLNKRDQNGKLYINPEGVNFYLSPTAPGEIIEIINALEVNKSSGPNGIPVFLLKMFKEFFGNWLSKLINLCFETGVFPLTILFLLFRYLRQT